MSVIRLLVCGSRDYSNVTRLEAILDGIHRKHAIEILIHGACHLGGADLLADAWAKSRRVPVDPFPVRESDGPWPGAGPERNRRMLIVGYPTHCVAFPGSSSRGTWDMVRKFNEWPARQANAWVIGV